MSTSTSPLASVTTWSLDPAHSSAHFKVRHMMIANVRGEFRTMRGSLLLDNDDISHSRLEVEIDAQSIFTRDEDRDKHLRSADFFDVAQFPHLTFRSTSIRRNADGDVRVTGDLTIHGVTRQVSFDVENLSPPARDPWGGTRLGASASFKVNRKDFGLTWNSALEAGGVLVGEEVLLEIDLQFVKAT